MLKTALAIICCVTLSACCGFKMRGDLEIPNYLKTVYITPNAPYDPLQSAVRARLKQYNVKIVAQPSPKTTTLELSKVTSGTEALAEGSSGEIQRYKVSVNVSYTLNVPENKYKTRRTITRSRELNRSINMLLSNEGEEQIVKKELLNEAV